jgi:hypothetical protein
MDHYIYMHGGFENETPNIPTNTIVKLDLTTVFKGNATLLSKLEQFVGSSAQAGSRSASAASASTKNGSDTNSRSQTPPGLGAKADTKIKISQPEVDFGDGQKPKMVPMYFMDKKDGKAGGPGTVMGIGKQLQSVDTLYSLFLNILLRPREWSA